VAFSPAAFWAVACWAPDGFCDGGGVVTNMTRHIMSKTNDKANAMMTLFSLSMDERLSV
jgi:hypothetical protein